MGDSLAHGALICLELLASQQASEKKIPVVACQPADTISIVGVIVEDGEVAVPQRLLAR
jgi:hypothetical protein